MDGHPWTVGVIRYPPVSGVRSFKIIEISILLLDALPSSESLLSTGLVSPYPAAQKYFAYCITLIDDYYYLCEHRIPGHSIWQFKVENSEVKNPVSIY